MFKLTEEMGVPWIPYLSLAVILFSGLGAVGLLKYRQWGFYGIYLGYLTGALIVWFPFIPGFMFTFTQGMYRGIITLLIILAVLSILIYLHAVGKKRLYFRKPVQT
jgi:hypothetical protein